MDGYNLTTPQIVFQSAEGVDRYGLWFKMLVKSLNVLNLMDSVFTLIWVNLGIAEEANIFLKGLINENALMFILAKISLVSLGSLLLWRYRWRFIALAGLILVFSAYTCIFIYHLHFMKHLF